MAAIKFLFFTALIGVAVGIIQSEPNGPIFRAKRFARNPLSYMNKVNPSQIEFEAPAANLGPAYFTKRFLLGRDQGDGLTPVKSHFREFRVAQEQAHNDDDFVDASPAVNLPRATRRYVASRNEQDLSPRIMEELANRAGPMSEEELRAWILLLDGYALSTKPEASKPSESYRIPAVQSYNPSYWNPDDIRRAARMYAMGKREPPSNSGRFFDLEQPESLDNDAEQRLEFFTPKRSKRVGGPPHPAESHDTQEDEIPEPRALPLAGAAPSGKASETVTSGAPSKKAIDWSYYFGIDKKDGQARSSGAAAGEHPTAMHAHGDAATAKPLSTDTAPETTTGGPADPKPPKVLVAARITEPSKSSPKESKEQKKLRMREENETENKTDRKWILNEFYKNLAMSTNVKRKREVNPKDASDDLIELEQKMEQAGDEIIWKTLKYAGAHKDEPMSPEELAQVKKDIIAKLAAAYNLEKIREAIETFREQIIGMKTNNIEQ